MLLSFLKSKICFKKFTPSITNRKKIEHFFSLIMHLNFVQVSSEYILTIENFIDLRNVSYISGKNELVISSKHYFLP